MKINPEYEIAWEKLRFPDEAEDDYDDEDGHEGYNDSEPKFMPIASLIQTNNNPFFQIKNYDFWTGHTNFKITEPIAVIMSKVLGVESLEVMSPYRFHISIGSRFIGGEVMSEISAQVVEFLEKYEKNCRDEQYSGRDS